MMHVLSSLKDMADAFKTITGLSKSTGLPKSSFALPQEEKPKTFEVVKALGESMSTDVRHPAALSSGAPR